jgi:hypothetical protein
MAGQLVGGCLVRPQLVCGEGTAYLTGGWVGLARCWVLREQPEGWSFRVVAPVPALASVGGRGGGLRTARAGRTAAARTR